MYLSCGIDKPSCYLIMLTCTVHKSHKILNPYKGFRIYHLYHCRNSHKLTSKILMQQVNCNSHGNTEKMLLDEHRSKMVNKAAAVSSGLFDFRNDIRDGNGNDSERMVREMHECEVLSGQKRFPGIEIGSSLPVFLYDVGCPEEEDGRDYLVGDDLRLAGERSVKVEGGNQALPLKSMGAVSVEVSLSIKEEKSSVSANVAPILKDESMDMKIKRNLYEEEILKVKSSTLSVEPVSKLDDVVDANAMLGLDTLLSDIAGLSSKERSVLEENGFYTLRKLLRHFPRTYADLKSGNSAEVEDGVYLFSIGKIKSSKGFARQNKFSFVEVVVACEVKNDENTEEGIVPSIMEKKMIYLHLKRYFSGKRCTSPSFIRMIASGYIEGDTVCVSGKVKAMSTKNHYEIKEYSIDVIEDEKDSADFRRGRPYPVYPAKGGIHSNIYHAIISRVLQVLAMDIDPIPVDIRGEFGLLNLHDAYMGIHHPMDLDEADLARKRLIFDEFFYLQLGQLFQMLEPLGTQIERDGLLDKYKNHDQNAFLMKDCCSLTQDLLKAIPFSLTPSQKKAALQIMFDLKHRVPMNRLLQGDVGCGKTVVAVLACMEVIGSGYQAAFMAPTELLAHQHHGYIQNLLDNIDRDSKPSIALLTGSTPTKLAKVIRQGLQTGDISLVVGTHSLISDSVEFFCLRIAIVDEQHRFGVVQRGKLNSKLCSSSLRTHSEKEDISSQDEVFMAPHVLAMSATPIPRTLALALYGDVSLTQITDLPPGRLPIETYVKLGNKIGFETVYQMIRSELREGGKGYIVYPIIDSSEQLPQLRACSDDFERISSEFKDYSCGLLHGRMKGEEKMEILGRFRSGEINILLATQVIEIGVDVPDASIMVVMNAERFGIAQLHQLRGRVGRGTKKSKCVFIVSSDSAVDRLKVLEKSSDGFYLANVDLLLRGPGDLLGKKQSGHLPEFPIARLETDGSIVEEAHLAALKILGTSHDLECFPNLKAELSMRQPVCLS